MNTRFDGTDDIMDSRDITERITVIENDTPTDDNGDYIWDDSDEMDEYEALITLRDEAGYHFDNQESFISEDYFVEYAEEFCKDVGYIPEELPSWIADHIDWEEVADEIKVDYTAFEFRGTTYWVR